AKTFELGRRSFLAEARLLAQFRHPGLLEVLHFWEQNGTAYMVMPFYEGRTLDQVLANGPQEVTEAWLKAVIRPVLDALEHMHGEDCYHRDVSADNILIRNDGKALLLDLGAARRVIGESDRALTVMLKPGYAPIEQYADDPACRQGPWTDVYAVAAVLHFAITNRMPPASASRVMHDSLPSLASLAPSGYSQRFLEAIDRGLSIRPEERPRTVGEFRSLLFAASPDQDIAGTEARSGAVRGRGNGDSQPARADAVRTPAPRSRLARSAGIVAAALVAAGVWLALGEDPAPAASVAAETAPALSSSGAASAPRLSDPALVDPVPVPEPTAATDASLSSSLREARAGGAQSTTPAPRGVAAAPSAGARAAPISDAPAPSAPATSAPATGTGTLRLVVAPWGEVFVDGASRGVTPPLKQLTLDAGSHRIEIRNPAGKTWTKEVDVVAGARTTITHRFP
ncbi:MAG TPA: protein kinase, partial [Zeimonas sp.]